MIIYKILFKRKQFKRIKISGVYHINYLNKVLLAVVISGTLIGFSSQAYSQAQTPGDNKQEDKVKKEEEKKPDLKNARTQQGPEQKKGQQGKSEPAQQSAQAEKEQRKPLPSKTSQQKMQHEQSARIQAAEKQQTAREAEQKNVSNKQMQQHGNKNVSENNKPSKLHPSQKPMQKVRLPKQQQQVLIKQQQQRVVMFRQNMAQRHNDSKQQGLKLKKQKRNSQYLFQQQYYERMRVQQIGFWNSRHDYDNDPYYYTASSYRYNRDGRYYETNQYGADVLRQALNYGYQEGMRAGRADQQDNWRYSYRDSYIYEDANYGYNGYYVQQDDYNYYFRQGFQRGYEDGYYGRRQYGRNYNNSDSLLSAILTSILGLESLR